MWACSIGVTFSGPYTAGPWSKGYYPMNFMPSGIRAVLEPRTIRSQDNHDQIKAIRFDGWHVVTLSFTRSFNMTSMKRPLAVPFRLIWLQPGLWIPWRDMETMAAQLIHARWFLTRDSNTNDTNGGNSFFKDLMRRIPASHQRFSLCAYIWLNQLTFVVAIEYVTGIRCLYIQDIYITLRRPPTKLDPLSWLVPFTLFILIIWFD